MSKRYGRKQKATARAKIAELTVRLEHESTERMYLPRGDEPNLGDLARVMEYSVTEMGGAGMMIEREASVVVEEIEDIYTLVRDQTPVQFQGKRYLIGNADYDVRTRFDTFGGPVHCRFSLVGVSS